MLRDSSLRPSILEGLGNKFKTVISYRLAEDLNEILICAKEKNSSDGMKKKLSNACRDINGFFKKNRSNCDDHVEIDEYLCNLKIS